MSQMRTGTDRAAKWERRYDPDHIRTVTAQEKSIYSARAREKFEVLYEMEVAVKQVLNAAGVSTYQVAPYLAYARQVWKLQQTHHGLTLARQVAIVITRCVAMSLEQSVLELIRSQVFDVPAPGPS